MIQHQPWRVASACGAWRVADGFPSAKALGYVQASLRDSGAERTPKFYLVRALEASHLDTAAQSGWKPLE